MTLKNLEKIKLIETALLLGVPIGMLLFTNSPENVQQYSNWQQLIANRIPDDIALYTALAAIPRLTDALLTFRIEPSMSDYKEIESLYNNIVSNLAIFLKKLNILDPVEIFTVYQFMYRNGYLSYNHSFNYDISMKDLAKLNGADVIRGTGVCRSIASFLTDLYKEMGYNSCNLLVNANSEILNNIDRKGNYPKWKISKKTNSFVKAISKMTNIASASNHLITFVEKDDNSYIFDPTNDAFLIKGKKNELVLPNNKEGRMKISYIMNSFNRITGSNGNLESKSKIKNQLEKPSIDYKEYENTYKNTLLFIKDNLLLFEEFYNKNFNLYVDLFQKINNQSSLLERLYPEFNLKNLDHLIELLEEKESKSK